MKIGAVIPVIGKQHLYGLMDCMEKQSRPPDKILIINNIQNPLAGVLAGKTIDFETWSGQKSFLPVFVHTPPEPMRVNASWTFGIDFMLQNNMNLISILNDDIIITENFFFVLEASALHKTEKDSPVFCPVTVMRSLPLQNAFFGYLQQMRRREGWAFSIRAEAARRCPKIPLEHLQTFCGDDWFFHHLQPWMKMTTNPIHHLVGGSTRGNPVRGDMNKEKMWFNEWRQRAVAP